MVVPSTWAIPGSHNPGQVPFFAISHKGRTRGGERAVSEKKRSVMRYMSTNGLLSQCNVVVANNYNS